MLLTLTVCSRQPFHGRETPAELVLRALTGEMHITITARQTAPLSRAGQRALRAHRKAAHGIFGVDEHGQPLLQGDCSTAIDYRDPANLVELLFQRNWAVLYRSWVTRVLAEQPGPLYYPDVDRDEHGRSWQEHGERWISQLERKLHDDGAILPRYR